MEKYLLEGRLTDAKYLSGHILRSGTLGLYVEGEDEPIYSRRVGLIHNSLVKIADNMFHDYVKAFSHDESLLGRIKNPGLKEALLKYCSEEARSVDPDDKTFIFVPRGNGGLKFALVQKHATAKSA